MKEGFEYFRQEIDKKLELERDAKLLVRGQGQLLKRVGEIVEFEWRKRERKLTDVV
ncbi:MAG: hypothetical protein AAB512_00085 [Patescibacteria group bacterium]